MVTKGTTLTTDKILYLSQQCNPTYFFGTFIYINERGNPNFFPSKENYIGNYFFERIFTKNTVIEEIFLPLELGTFNPNIFGSIISNIGGSG